MKINKKYLLFLLFIIAVIGIFVLSFLESKRRQNTQTAPSVTKKISLLNTPQEMYRKLPYEPLILRFSDNPESFHCKAENTTLTNVFEIFSVYQGNNMIINSRTTWPEGSTIPFLVTCDGFGATVNFTIDSGLTQEQQFTTDAKNEIETSLQRQEYMESHPYIESFPLKRASYAIFYIEKQNVMYVSPKNGAFTEAQKQALSKNERPEVKALGVPDDVPFVFSLPE